jgi:hypothetical protein
MFRSLTGRRLALSCAVALGLGVGCGSSGSGGCSGFRPLPKDTNGNLSPAPFGLPSDQIVEGGLQARITKPGMDKLLSVVPSLLGGISQSGLCIGYDGITGGSILGINYCDRNDCSGGAQGCPAFIYLNSKDLPSGATPPLPPQAANMDDGKDKIVVTVNESSASVPPTVTIDLFMDALFPLHTNNNITQCYFWLHTDHLADPKNKDPLHIQAQVELDIAPDTGELSPNITNVAVMNSGLPISITGTDNDHNTGGINGFLCGLGGSIGSGILNVIGGIGFLRDLIINNVVKPALQNAIKNLLPKPLGLAGVVDTSQLLASLSPPAGAGLELFVVPGGYVQSKAGGLTLGVMSGVNSDRDESTRTPGLTSEPSLCVPARATPILSQTPWSLPFNVGRKDYTLNPANEFSGNPDPKDANGNV